METTTTTALEYFGFIITWFIIIRIIIIKWLWQLLKYLWIFYLQNPQKHYQKYFQLSTSSSTTSASSTKSNGWSIITGGTDGIGLAYCKQLARFGYRLFIISRSIDKLESIRSELYEQYPQCPEIRIFQFDFSENFESINYDRLEIEIEKLSKINILINNVGISYHTTEYFTKILQQEPKFNEKIINVNIVSVLRLTLICLPKMIEQQQQGIIINISSLSAICPMPLLSSYSASKACIDHFTQCLQLELQQQQEKYQPQIHLQSILPGFIATKMSKMLPSLTVPTANNYVKLSLLSIGHTNRTFVYFFHCLHNQLYQFFHYFSFINFYQIIAFKQMLKLRQKYLQKRKQQKQKIQ
ncbi:very-long-chain 3-oxoacyl-CoA reductase-like [Dermatophagoides pteronyssinus]|uniref:very-long-chain 3-oxoacyl-CoA reductase-like n=1 Tax=Dermatophagoides pteronyssinus TaxID=6956 RepID=UPI003F66308C